VLNLTSKPLGLCPDPVSQQCNKDKQTTARGECIPIKRPAANEIVAFVQQTSEAVTSR